MRKTLLKKIFIFEMFYEQFINTKPPDKMKKLILVVMVLFAFASCKKDRVCVCTSGTLQVADPTTYQTKKKAKDDCNALEESYRNKGSDVTCELE
jgi:hypothetical protein